MLPAILRPRATVANAQCKGQSAFQPEPKGFATKDQGSRVISPNASVAGRVAGRCQGGGSPFLSSKPRKNSSISWFRFWERKCGRFLKSSRGTTGVELEELLLPLPIIALIAPPM